MIQQFENVGTILLDLDDTLWENNTHFLHTIEQLARVGRHHGLTNRAVEHIINTF